MYDAIVLAGGAARRLGGVVKPQLTVGGATLLDRVVAAVPDAGTVVVVGPRQPLAEDLPAAARVLWCREQPPGGGPVAALAAALPLTSSSTVVVLAADLPWIAPAVPRLRAGAAGPGEADVADVADVAVLVDADGRLNHLAAAWSRPALAAALARIGEPAGAPARALLAGLSPALVRDEDGWGADCDTWDDLRAAQMRAVRAAQARGEDG